MKYKNILITGGCGFIGSNFIHYLFNNLQNVNIVNIDNLTYAGNEKNLKEINSKDSYTFYRGDISDENLINEILEKHEINCIINFAAESHVDLSIKNPKNFINTNILGTFNLINSFNNFINKKNEDFLFLHISTDEVFGSLDKMDPPFEETSKIKPNSPYSASKASSDMLVRAWHKTYNFPSIITNCSNNYGPYQFPEKLITLTIFNAVNGKNINIYGDGSNIRDWLYVEDHCSAIFEIMQNGKKGESYNIGGNNELDNNTLVRYICEILDELYPSRLNNNSNCLRYAELIKYVSDRAGHDFRYSINSNKLSSNLNWKPKTDFMNGLKKTVKWYLDNEDWVNNSFLNND